ncbi:tRNA uridine-5-carboxymethylaminomethyl(34) synthesis GTPase MnmE [Aquabacterium sp. OR-4]|uniref:tRNA uridine-5-carboxymethylaminomethyl(34) synthesis GTPase MnmE n=1 Tax=Aquabacterium sp. OR-4 TaxID=2978127 RepID=UPI0028CA438D|nr:tRNA uridine-5-carboxymethylaminomethyl(34) synthesis GTPase MnmE [Aquabacterium sp. OR-4]MDT7833761.1 tRNA uridine-5-carboxymethylaminomethyl(34) synthesis GTPase MnmE [Aquabacterium sp. OR-4]
MSLARREDPIVAIATAAGRGAVGIVRVSGRGLAPLVQRLLGRLPAPRHAHYGPFAAADGQPIDQGLALWFPAPHSYTGEDVLELQAHGGPVLLQLLLARCLEAAAETGTPGAGARALLPGLRLAEPGEFTERAFLNDKLDLAQAEAVADLIDASTEAAARSAGRSLSGAFSHEIEALRGRVVHLRMLVEATLDFPEEEIDFLERADARGQLDAIQAALAAVMGRARQGALLREGLSVVLAGQPNVGKSSLLNALAGAELAIVTAIPGTTRDKVSQTIQIEGVPLHVIDTAGLRADEDASDEVERIGIARSWAAIAEADAVIFLHDLTRRGQPAYEAAEAEIALRLAAHGVQRLVHVHNKRDGVAAEVVAALPAGEIALSAKAGEGLRALRHELLRRAGWQAAAEGVFIARRRHVQALERTAGHLALAAGHAAAADAALDLFAEELRLAHEALGEITGRFTADDLLGVIFGSFCIGK